MKSTRALKRQIKRWRRRITYSDPFLEFISSLSVFFIKCYMRLLRIQIVLDEKFKKTDLNKTLVAFWHGRLLLPVYTFGHWHMVIMTDKSWAGEILARILRKFGHKVVRGSSKRSGFRGVLDMMALMQKGHGGALAVDGPHGPIHKTKPGILYMAHKLNYPIVPLTFGADRAWIFKSTWDHFMLPKPFAKCRVHMGAPIWETTVKGKITAEALDEIIMKFTSDTDQQLQS
ncbi:lysophospholipid acyltransferase family protein [bacterium]|nr:lysophospholipid acyltransferase family protein [bacterium]